MVSEVPFIRQFFEDQNISGLNDAAAIPFEYVIKGGMPSVYLGNFRYPVNWYKGYEHTYLDRDIRDLGRIGDIIPFRGLLHLAAHRWYQVGFDGVGVDSVVDFGQVAADIPAQLLVFRLFQALEFLDEVYFEFRTDPHAEFEGDVLVGIRQAHFRDGKSIHEICREYDLARNTVINIIRSGVPIPNSLH